MNSALTLSLLALLCSAIAAGATFALGRKALSASELVSPAASGALLMLAIVHLAPEALALNDQAPILVAIGLVGAVVLHVTFHGAGAGKLNEITLLIGVALHSFLDGVILSTTGHAGGDVLLASAPGMLLHEIPEAIACYFIIRRFSRSALVATTTAVFTAGVTTVLGVVSSEPLIASATTRQLGGLMALSAGLLLYSSGSLLLSISTDRMLRRGVCACAGAAAFICTVWLAPSHKHGLSPNQHRDHAHVSNDEQPDFSAYRYLPQNQQPKPAAR